MSTPEPPSLPLAASGPAPPPAPGTANVALCNFIGKATVFKILGIQGEAVVTKNVSVPAYSYLWSAGWAAGHDKMLSVVTPYFTKTFAPFVTSDIVVIYQALSQQVASLVHSVTTSK